MRRSQWGEAARVGAAARDQGDRGDGDDEEGAHQPAWIVVPRRRWLPMTRATIDQNATAAPATSGSCEPGMKESGVALVSIRSATGRSPAGPAPGARTSTLNRTSDTSSPIESLPS